MNFTDAQTMALLYPDSFEAPTNEDLNDLQVGQYVKVCINGEERLWVLVTAIALNIIYGELANDPVIIDAKFGDHITFEKRHIYQILYDEV